MTLKRKSVKKLALLCSVLLATIVSAVLVASQHSYAGGLNPAALVGGKPYNVGPIVNNEIRVTMLQPEMTEAENNKAWALAARDVAKMAKGYTQAEVLYETENGTIVTKSDGRVVIRQDVKIYRIKPIEKRRLQSDPRLNQRRQGAPPNPPPVQY